MTTPASPLPITPPPTLRAAGWMSLAIVSFLSMAVAGRAVSSNLDTFEIMTYRSLTGIVLISLVITLTKSWGKVTTHRMGLHILRNIAHFTGQNLWFFAITVIPLAQVFALEFTSPLWILVLSPVFLGEKMTARRALVALTGFAGILLIARPGAQAVTPGLIAAALCAVGFACTVMTTKLLTRDTATLCILFWLTVLQAIFGAICGGFDGDFALPSAEALPWVILVGIAGLLAHFCVTTALSIAPATLVAPMDFIRLPAAAILGLLLYAEPLDPFVLIGAAIILGANYANIRGETRA
ncbi:DMT family transporter [Pseudooceanicola sp. C21-150M6]|uniref:DMT family transporter n=1 Tax=Pseudooceanicola sp. C21-150M6 TaxID=3434355 RepID=UPI003D7F5FBD